MSRAGASVIAYLGLGSNLGDRRAQMQDALSDLESEGVAVLRTSPVYESDYVGPGEPQPRYLDAVAEARTQLAPLSLLDLLQRIEARHGRRPETHLRPRPLDLDILLYGGWTVRHPRLLVPHPRLPERCFWLRPLRDLGVLERWPDLGLRLEALATVQPLERAATLAPGRSRAGISG